MKHTIIKYGSLALLAIGWIISWSFYFEWWFGWSGLFWGYKLSSAVVVLIGFIWTMRIASRRRKRRLYFGVGSRGL